LEGRWAKLIVSAYSRGLNIITTASVTNKQYLREELLLKQEYAMIKTSQLLHRLPIASKEAITAITEYAAEATTPWEVVEDKANSQQIEDIDPDDYEEYYNKLMDK